MRESKKLVARLREQASSRGRHREDRETWSAAADRIEELEREASRVPSENGAACYAARRRVCRCLVGAVVDDEGRNGANAATVSSWIRAGLVVDRESADTVRQELGECNHEDDGQTRIPGT